MDHGSHIPAQRLTKRPKFIFGIADQNIVVGVIRMQHQEGDQLFGAEGFTSPRYAQQKGRLVQEVCLVAHDEVVGNGVLPKINTALVLDLLHFERNEYRKALGGQSAERIDFARPNGQRGVQAVKLLELQCGKLAHMLAGNGKNRLSIAVKLFFGIGGDGQRDDGEHHPLIAGGEVVQKLLALLALQFHVIRHHRREVVVGVLATLPVGDVGFHTQQPVFHLADGLIGGNRHNVDGEHHVPVEVRQLRYHIVLDIAGVILEEQDAAVFFAQLQIVAVLLDPVRADIIAEVMAVLHHLAGIEPELGLLALAVEIVQDTQALGGVQLNTFGTQRRKVRNEICSHTGKVGTGFFNVLFHHGNGDILLLRDSVGTGGLVQQHLIVLPAILITEIPLHGHEDGLLKVGLVHTAVVDGDLRHRTGIQRVQQLRISQEHGFLVLAAGHKIVDVGELIGLGEFRPHEKNAIRPDTADGDHILHLARHIVAFLFLFGHSLDGFNHALPPSVCSDVSAAFCVSCRSHHSAIPR